MTSAPTGQFSVRALVLPLAWLARLISGPMRSPMSARAARGAASRIAASVSFVTGRNLRGLQKQTTPRPPRPLLGRELQHPLYRPQRAHAQLLRQRDLRLPVAHAEVELLQGVEP